MLDLAVMMRILHIDDSLPEQRLVKSVLEAAAESFQIDAAGSRQEMLSCLRHDHFVLILTELDLFGFAGLGVLAFLREEKPQVPVVVFTSRGSEDIAVEALQNGAWCYLRKSPRNLQRLPDLITRVVCECREKCRLQNVDAALKESEERLELALTGANAGVWDLRMDPARNDGSLGDEIYISPHLKKLIGFADDELPNSIKAWQERVIPEDLPLILRSSQDHLQGRSELHEVRYRVLHKDGSIRWIYSRGKIFRDADGRPLRWTGIDTDITAQKQAEAALLDSERLYRTLTQSMADGVALIQEGRVVFANESLAKMCGHRSPEAIMGGPAEQFLQQIYQDHEKEIASLRESDKDWVPGKVTEAMCEAHDGKRFWASAHSTVIKWRDQPGVLAVVRDVTEIMAREEAARQEVDQLKGEFQRLKSTIKERYRFGKLVGKSEPMQKVYDLILKAAKSDASVVVFGETGSGKELVARAVHELSPRSGKTFVPVNCGAIPESLIESEFFGHKKGAFTGAYLEKHGYLHTADGGTLFLDEIGEIGLNLQVKLLRAIESGEYVPLGDARVKHSNVRFVAATSRNLAAMVQQGLMREDFFYRIAVILIPLPPLRERKEDLPLLIEHFLKLYGGEPKPTALPGKVIDALLQYDWPGNVRELQNVLQRYLTVRTLDFLPAQPQPPEGGAEAPAAVPDSVQNLNQALLQFEKALILKALEQHQWNKTKAAEALGIDRRSLFRKMEKTGIL